MEPRTCEGCAEECDPAHCVDCPECAVAAEPGERQPELRPWFAGLTEVGSAGWSDAAFIVLVLSGVTYDGLQETAPFGSAMNALFAALLPVIGALNTVLVVQTILPGWRSGSPSWASSSLASWVTLRMHDPDRQPPRAGQRGRSLRRHAAADRGGLPRLPTT